MRKFSIFLILVAGIIFGIFSDFKFEFTGKKDEKSVTILFVGDIMLSREIGKIIEREGVDFPFELIKDLTLSHDITFGNLENPVSVRGKNVGSIYSFRADPKALLGLKNAGFDVVSLANNHIFDWGPDALLDTVMHLKSHSIKSAGAGENYKESHTPVIINKNEINIAFLAYSEFASFVLSSIESSPNVANINLAIIKDDINRAKEIFKVDIVVVSLHWGEEYKTRESEIQKEIAHSIIDAGADFVIGHHPHVIQGVEEYNGGVIAHSLGNFIFDQNFSEDTKKGLILEVEVGKENPNNFANKPELVRIKSYKTKIINFTPAFQPYIINQ